MVRICSRISCRSALRWLLVFCLLASLPAALRAADTDVVINEIMYHPDTDCEGEEFIELYNRNVSQAVNLSNWRFSEGVSYTFPGGTILAPNSYLVVCGDRTAFNNYYSTPPCTLLWPWTGHLANDGEDIVLVNSIGAQIDRVRFNDKRPWPISPDGAGPSLELINPNDDNTSAGAWRAATSNWLSTTWRQYQVTGVPSSTTVYFYLDSVGICLIDDIELRATTNPIMNYINNGSFETASPLQWTATGTHSGSVRVTSDAHAGSACMAIVASGAGGAASGQVWQYCLPITFNGPTYMLSFWAKGLQPGVVLRVGMRPAATGTPWSPSTSQDIGGPTPAGGYTYYAGPPRYYRVSGAGADIWGGSDQFHYLYAALSGDGVLQAKAVFNPAPFNDWSKAGIMIRETLAADSKHVFAMLSRDYGARLQYRDATGGGSSDLAGPLVAPGTTVPLRLRREGNDFIAEADTGGGFQEYASVPVTMNANVYIGFAVTSHQNGTLARANFYNPTANAGAEFYTEVSISGFFATPGAPNSCYSTNLPPYIRNVDTFPDQPTSALPIQVRAKITDSDGITSAVLRYQIVPPGSYIRLGDPAYQTNWTTVNMTPATTPTYYVATIPAQAHRTLVRYRVSARDGTGRETTVPYPDDPEPNYARFVYNGVPSYYASPRPGVQPFRWHTILTKIPVIQLIANAADVNEAQTISLYDRVERRQFKWYATVVFNGIVYDHVRFRMRGGTWRYKYNKRMWKFRFNQGHYLDFLHNDGTPYEEELRTLNLTACIQPPGNVPSWVATKYGGDSSQRGEAGIVEQACYWLWQRVGAIAPDTTWIHYRIVDNASETGADQFSGDFFGLYLAVQGMDERMLRMNDRPVGNLYKIDSYGYSNPPWAQDAMSCALPVNDIVEFRRQYGPAGGYPTPTKQWWEQNFDLDSYYSCRTVIDFSHHGDLYPTTNYDGVESGKNYYYYHNPDTNKWEFIAWDIDLSFGTDHGGGNSPFRDRVVRNGSFPEFGIAYKNRLREAIQLQFYPQKFFPKLDEWRNLLVEIAAADMDRWNYPPATGPEDFEWWGHFQTLDTRLADIKYWITERIRWLTMQPSVNWWLETSSSWPHATCWDPDIPTTPTLTSPAGGSSRDDRTTVVLTSSAYSDPNGNPHAASKWIATRLYGNELKPDWSSGITTTSLTTKGIPAGALVPGSYWLRVRHMDNTGRWSWWSQGVSITVTPSIAGTIRINAGAAYTTLTAVALSLTATGTLPITQMRFSNDNITWSGWEAYAPAKAWTLASGDGLKTVYCQVRDSGANTSVVFTDTITLDTLPPSGNILINFGAAFTNVTAVTLSLAATDAGSGVSQMRFSNNGSSWSTWEAYGTSKAWTLPSGDGLKTVYAQFRDNVGRASASSTDTITLDTAPPAGSVTVNAGAAYTSSVAVTLALSATDARSGVAQMRFSNNGSAWNAWEAYGAGKAWTLTAGDGLKTVYAQFQDGANNASASSTDTIRLDMTAPAGSIVINSGAAKTNSTSVTLTLSATDAGSGVARMRFSNDDFTWSAWAAYATRRTGWILTSGDGPKAVYAQFRDAIGNSSPSVSDTITLDTRPVQTAAANWPLYE